MERSRDTAHAGVIYQNLEAFEFLPDKLSESVYGLEVAHIANENLRFSTVLRYLFSHRFERASSASRKYNRCAQAGQLCGYRCSNPGACSGNHCTFAI
jgi:hypothetical protein